MPNLQIIIFKGTQKIRNVQIEDYIKAGKIAAEVREKVRAKNWVGKTVYEICEEVEGEIKKRGAKCAFPVNTSINEVAAHYTAEPNDPITIKDDDLVKIDLGAQINGYIADTAVTVCYDAQFDVLVQAAEEALGNAMSMAKSGVRVSDIVLKIEKTRKKKAVRQRRRHSDNRQNHRCIKADECGRPGGRGEGPERRVRHKRSGPGCRCRRTRRWRRYGRRRRCCFRGTVGI